MSSIEYIEDLLVELGDHDNHVSILDPNNMFVLEDYKNHKTLILTGLIQLIKHKK